MLINNISKLTYANVKKSILNKGYKFFDSAPYDLNLGAFRSTDNNMKDDTFKDIIFCAYLDEHGKGNILAVKATTRPGLVSLTDPFLPEQIKNGTAIILEGQYPRVFRLAYHGIGAFKHVAFVQCGNFTIARDNDRDCYAEITAKIQSGNWFGTNLHSTKQYNRLLKVGKYGAGCQVVEDQNDHDQLVSLGVKQAQAGLGNLFTYTLMGEKDLIL